MQAGFIVKSLKGHDEGRLYMVAAVVNESFVLLVDGKYRKIDNPKQKRIKHLEVVGKANGLPSQPKDSDIRKICKSHMEGVYAERR